jgi:hypothetical protein
LDFKVDFTLKKSHYLKDGRGWGQGEEMTQALYAHMNNKRKKNPTQKNKKIKNKRE